MSKNISSLLLCLISLVCLSSPLWGQPSALTVSKAILPDAPQSYYDKKMHTRGMYHNGVTVFTPLGQLNGTAVASKLYSGLLVYHLEPSSALGEAGVRPWDLIVKVNRTSLSSLTENRSDGTPPIKEFGKALLSQESEGGTMTVTVRRHVYGDLTKSSKEIQFKVPIKKLGSLDALLNKGQITGRAQQVTENAVKYLLKTQAKNGSWKCGYGSQLPTSLAGVHLLMAAKVCPALKEEIHTSLKKAVRYLDKNRKWAWSWDHGSSCWFLSEYYWATGDFNTYLILHDYLKKLDYSVNPMGGVCHKPMRAPYGSVNMGGTAGLALIAFKAADLCSCSFDRETTTQLMDYHIFDRLDGDATAVTKVGYSGYMLKTKYLKESGFTSAAYLLGLQRPSYKGDSYAKEKKTSLAQIYQFLQKNYRMIDQIHATPSFGLIFGSLAFSAGENDSTSAYQNALIQERRWHIALSQNSNGDFLYVYPRYARLAIPGGGGWNGDKLMGLKHLASLISIVLINAPSKNLLVNAGVEKPKSCWLSGKNAATAKEEVMQYHKKNIDRTVLEIAELHAQGQFADALSKANKLIYSYPLEAYPWANQPALHSTLTALIQKGEKEQHPFPDPRKEQAVAYLDEVSKKLAKKRVLWDKFFLKYLEKYPKNMQSFEKRVQKILD